VTFADPRDDGTAIGTGITTAVNRLRTSKAKSRVVILLTDGINNAGSIDPLTAADLARAVGIRVHAIGVGSDGPVVVPLPDGSRIRAVLPINEEELRRIAGSTGGSYFRATDSAALAEIFKKIDGMEKTRIEVLSYGRYDELFVRFLVPALAVLTLGFASAGTFLARVP
ncbi:MAG: VWA domain-containing protein, partial [Vicinamibacteria bacterium]